MTITAAHISADRRPDCGSLDPDHAAVLNFIVAIYLIFVGLVGLGVFKCLQF